MQERGQQLQALGWCFWGRQLLLSCANGQLAVHGRLYVLCSLSSWPIAGELVGSIGADDSLTTQFAVVADLLKKVGAEQSAMAVAHAYAAD